MNDLMTTAQVGKKLNINSCSVLYWYDKLHIEPKIKIPHGDGFVLCIDKKDFLKIKEARKNSPNLITKRFNKRIRKQCDAETF